jgi:hypothetical protein
MSNKKLKMLLIKNRQVLYFVNAENVFPKNNFTPIVHSEIFEKKVELLQKIRKNLSVFTFCFSMNSLLTQKTKP